MGKIMLITGGARSGKSQYAEQHAKKLGGNILYIATAMAYDDEMKMRIRKHQNSRPQKWETYEGYKGLGNVIREKGKFFNGILLDCVTIMTSNLMLEFCHNHPLEEIDFEAVENKILTEMHQLINGIQDVEATVILVTNELGSSIVPESKLGRVFRDIAGRVNQYLASCADEVYLTVCGMPMKIK